MTDGKMVKSDFNALRDMPPPAKRAAYSDRTAWLMAAFAELAYLHFDEEDDSNILSLAEDLVKLTDQSMIAERLRDLLEKINQARSSQSGSQNSSGQSNLILREILSAVDFKLIDIIHEPSTDTQGFVAVRPASGDNPGMAVLAFRGTQQIKDWLTNIKTDKVAVYSRNGARKMGMMHKGFHEAFMSVKERVDKLLAPHRDLPLYITGHSLGGALAVVATWYTPGEKLAACYTFGAPRVGNNELEGCFRTPIYRVVNGPDPVPSVPPSAFVINFFKLVCRLGAKLGLAFLLEPAIGFLVRMQNYRHYGYQRYLTLCAPEGDQYPNVKNLHGVGVMERYFRYIKAMREGAFTEGARVDKYHDMSIYRAKLRSWARKRHQNL